MPTRRNHFCLFAYLLLAALGMPLDAFATDYFVRKTGSNANAGTSAGTAWLTIDYAADNMSAGDTVYVGAGTYSERVTPSQSGTSGNPIRFIADTGGSQTGDAGDVLVTGSSGLETLNVSLNKDYLQFYNFKFQGSGNDTVRFYFSDNGVLDNCEIFGGTQGINAGNGNNFTVQDCIVRDNSSDGINVSFDTGMLVTGCEIYGNVSGIDVDSGGVTIRNCLIRDNSARGIDVTVGTVAVQNCTVVSNTTDGIHQGTGTLTVTNCILSSNGDDGLDYDAGTLTHTYNLIYGSGDLDYEGTSASTGEISLDPQFVSATDYRITTLSPARNAGFDLSGTVDDDFDGRVRPYDGAHDIGCYEEGPYAHWKLDETSGITAADSSGFSHDGTHSGSPTWSTTAQLGGSLDFETSDGADRVDAGNFDVVGTGLTLMAWVRQEDPLNDGRVITKSNGNGGSGTGDQSWGITIDEFGELDFRVAVGSAWRRLQAPGVISQDTWHLVAGTYDGTTMRLYVDGVLVNSLVHVPGGAIVGNSSHTVSLGDSSIGGRPFDGLIDDARIYDRTLSVDEIVELYGGLVGHWKMDETSGTVAVDSSSYGNDGTYTNGPILGSAGIYGYSAEFDGSDDYVEVPDDTRLQVTDMTLSAWVYIPSSIPAGFRVIFERGRNTLNWYGLYKSGVSDVFHFRWGNTGTFNSDFVTTIVANQWYLVTATYNSTTSEARLYLNGQLDRVVTGATAPTPAAGGLRIGRTLINNNEEFPGMIDDARLYNRALTATQIAELYGLMGHWKMNEGAGSTIADSTAFSNDATVNGATWTSDCASNNGLEFDGISDTATTNSNFDPPETGTVAVWLRSAGNPGARSHPFGLGENWEMRQETDGTLSFDLGAEGPDEGAGPDEFITTDALSFEDRWYHVVAHFDATDDSFEVYINGELTDSGTNGDDMVKQLADTLSFGTRTGSTEYWEGAMRDFRVYNRWLAGSEISELSGLVAYWKLDESSGTVAVDSSPNGNDGTYTGGVTLFQNGQVDQAAEFDGSDDYVGVPDDSSLQMDDVFSISGWIRPDSSSNIEQMILNKEGEYEIAISPSDELKWAVENTDPGWAWHSTGHIVAIGKWTHVAMIYDNGTVTTYANGVLVDTYNGSGTIGDQYTLLNELRLGGRSNNPTGKYFDGRLDDIRVFNRVLCPEEVFGQYKGGRPAGVRILKWVEVR